MMEDPNNIRFDGWLLDARSGELRRGESTTTLSELPLRLLVELASHAGQVVTREQLIQRLWPQGVVDFDAGLNTAMRKLRVALDDTGDKPRYIETLPRRGYRFIGQIEIDAGTYDSPQPQTESPVAKVTGIGRRARNVLLGATALAAVVAIVGFYSIWQKPADFGAVSTKIRIAILPFQNLSPDPDHAFFADGLHEQTIMVLGRRARDMEIVSRATMTTYRDRHPSAIDLAKDVGATHVLTGKVRRDSNAVRLSVELIDARTDSHLWSRDFERRLADAISLQSDVAIQVAEQLSSHLDEAAAQAKLTRNVEAFDLYLKARQETTANFRAVDRIAHTVSMLNRAIEIDPEFAYAYAERAEDNFLAFVGNWDVSQQRLDLVKADIDAAQRLAPNDPVLRANRAPYTAFKEVDPERALEEVSEGARLGHQDALEMQSLILWSMGRPDEADAVCRRILELDPFNEAIRVRRVSVLFAGRHWKEALAAARTIPSRAQDLGDIAEFEITGQSQRIANTFGSAKTFSDLGRDFRDPAVSLDTYLMYMRATRRFAEAQRFLESFPLQTVRVSSSAGGALPGLGTRPVDEHRAWLAMLSGKPVEALRYAKGIREFLRATPETEWNGWFLRLLAAEANLFEGNHEAAVRATREALAMAPVREANVRSYRYRERMAATTFAWAGAQDEAVSLLRSLAYDVPVIGASAIARDPFYSIPLAEHAGYRKLQAALEEEIKSLIAGAASQRPH